MLPLVLAAAVAPPASGAGYACGDQSAGRERCTRVVVPLDRTGTVPGEIGLSVRTIQPGESRRKVRREAVMLLPGGPGQAGTPLVQDLVRSLVPLQRKRDLVAVDTRGTGRSTDLIACPELESSAVSGLTQGQRIGSCARRIGPAIDRYATTDVVADLEAVRIAGGYDKLLLVGVSYGSLTAQRYAAAYPDRVSGMVLDSTVDAAPDDPFSLATLRAIPGALRNACARGACRGVTDDVLGDLRRTRERLPLTVTVDDGTGRRRPATLDDAVLLGLIQAGDLRPDLRSALPAALRRAGEGDPQPLARLARAVGFGAREGDDEDPEAVGAAGLDSQGSFLATLCRDTDGPWAPGTPPGEARSRAILDALAARSDAERGGWSPEDAIVVSPAVPCAFWPAEPEHASVPPAPDVPTLLLSGADDVRTPPEEARRVAARYPRSTVLDVPGVGHSVLTTASSVGTAEECVDAALGALVTGRPVRRCVAPAEVERAVPLVPSSPAELGRTGPARARAVARATILDAAREVAAATSEDDGEDEDPFAAAAAAAKSTRVAGLRSGSATRTAKGGLRLDRTGFVPGTAVTARGIRKQARISVVVRGKGLRPGRYTIANPLAR